MPDLRTTSSITSAVPSTSIGCTDFTVPGPSECCTESPALNGGGDLEARAAFALLVANGRASTAGRLVTSPRAVASASTSDNRIEASFSLSSPRSAILSLAGTVDGSSLISWPAPTPGACALYAPLAVDGGTYGAPAAACTGP